MRGAKSSVTLDVLFVNAAPLNILYNLQVRNGFDITSPAFLK